MNLFERASWCCKLAVNGAAILVEKMALQILHLFKGPWSVEMSNRWVELKINFFQANDFSI